jgi:translocation and assembly module TamA
LSAVPAIAAEVTFLTPGAERPIRSLLLGASLVREAVKSGAPPAEILAAARAEYARLLGVLYAEGHYAPVISVKLDGREAADLPLLADPREIGEVVVTVDPGPPFLFGRTELAPLAPGTQMPPEFARGEPARAGAVRAAVTAAVDGWRDAGHAKAEPGRQQIVADHPRATLDAVVQIVPGPRLRFGPLAVQGSARMRTERIRAIAGLPEGEVFSQAALERAAGRLRRSGAFRSVSLIEADRPGPGDLIGITALVEEEKLRRFGFGAELSSFEGLRLTGYWLHRNLAGGAERLRFDGEIAQIGTEAGGMDYRLGATFSRPATFTPDTTLTLGVTVAYEDEPGYDLLGFELTGGLDHVFTERLTGSVRGAYRQTRVEDRLGSREFRSLSLPASLTWDGRDDPFNPTRGLWLSGELRPFLGFGSTGSGWRLLADARAYRGLGAGDRLVLAARLQAGAVLGPTLADTPRDFLFYSGGGGTVRGQEYRSLGVFVLGGDQKTGGQAFAGLQTEARVKITGALGAVAFLDAGFVGATGFEDGTGDWHAGAGLGVRYDTPIGPIRVDLGLPVTGEDTGPQLYIGIGQTF